MPRATSSRASASGSVALAEAPRIALVKLSSLGDVVHALPRGGHPARRPSRGRISPGSSSGARRRSCAGIPPWTRSSSPTRGAGGGPGAPALSAPRCARSYRCDDGCAAARFDVAIDLQGLIKSGVLTAATRAPAARRLRGGPSSASRSNALFTNRAGHAAADGVARGGSVPGPAGRARRRASGGTSSACRRRRPPRRRSTTGWGRVGIKPRHRLVVLNPGAGRADKRWPVGALRDAGPAPRRTTPGPRCWSRGGRARRITPAASRAPSRRRARRGAGAAHGSRRAPGPACAGPAWSSPRTRGRCTWRPRSARRASDSTARRPLGATVPTAPATVRSRSADGTMASLASRAVVLPIVLELLGMTPRASLSVVVVTLNEEERIRACLESVAWADEVIVVDAESHDKTAAIARELTDHVIVRPWPGFAAQKNFGIAQAHGDWILSLDADEVVSPALRDGDPGGAGRRRTARRLFACRGATSSGAAGSGTAASIPTGSCGCFAAGAVASWSARCTSRWRSTARSAGCAGHLEHRSYRDVADFLERADRYSTLAADEWLAGGRGDRDRSRTWSSGRSAASSGMYVCAGRLPRRVEGIPSGRALWLLCVHAFGQDLGENEALMAGTGARAVGNAPEREAAPGELSRRAGQLGHACRTTTTASTSRPTGTCSPTISDTSDVPQQHHRDGRRLAGRRPRSRALDAVHPVAGARARRAAPALLDGDAGRLARAGADLQGAHRAAGDRLAVLRPARAIRCCSRPTSSCTRPSGCRSASIRRRTSS